ncbi:MAG TPA: hypothetical protein VN088_16180 [Nocardioides sp.]|nr:hypothetical protein [Nocardioides sp.]
MIHTARYRVTARGPLSGRRVEMLSDEDPLRLAMCLVDDGWTEVLVWEGEVLLAAQAR